MGFPRKNKLYFIHNLHTANEEHHEEHDAESTHEGDWLEHSDRGAKCVVPEVSEDREEDDEHDDEVEPEDNHLTSGHRCHHGGRVSILEALALASSTGNVGNE